MRGDDWGGKSRAGVSRRCERWERLARSVCLGLVVVGAAGLLSVFGGCGGAPSAPAGTFGAALSSTTQTGGPESGATESIPNVFSELALVAAPMPVYGWTNAPEGADLLKQWLPVVDEQDPASYDGPSVTNPRVSQEDGADPEIQVALTYEGGWLAVLENFRGDLGDVTGTDVGAIGGHPASLHEVNGGFLVQWSDGGRWYGVFGRRVSRDELVGLALGMVPLPVEGSR